MISTLIITIILGSITDIILPKTDFILLPPLAVVLCLIPIGGIWYAMIKYKLMNLNYESLMLDILKVIDDGIIIINHEGIIVEVNQGTLILLGYPNKRKLVNEHFKIIFKEGIDLSSISKLNNKEMEVRTSDNKYLPVLLQYQTIKDQLNDNLGSLIIFQDISELKKVQKALEKTRDNLEEKVLERTGELSKINFELKNEIKARIIVENEISKSAFCDSLTNLPNRRLFNDRLEQAILKASRNKDHLVLLYIDIDSFKHVNDTLGHIKGDRLLVEISIRLKNCLRKTDTIARVGGDEFLIILQDIKEDSDTLKITENILNCFKLPFRIDEQELKVTSSIGASIYPTDGLDFEALVKNADAAMYKAKESGRNKIEFCTFEMKEKRNETIMLTNSLYYAIERNEFELYYQPQVDARTNVICGVEALLRWHHPELGMVSPSIFIPIAENSGLIMAIGDWVLREACKQNKIWQDKGLLRIPVAVNVSIKQFSNSVITKSVREILKETGLSPDSLELEITEGIVMGDTETLIATLLELKEIGVQLAVDDFGTEYASLSYLKHLPIDRIKIAMTFIRGININIKDEIITQAIILLAQNLGMAVIAEGVEKREQLDFLQNSGCDMIQGFYYYKPMPKEELEKLLS
jgi:diguanylate cyclase (GGDEF)-like protein/PAS domain S-box-containing protein